MPPKRPPPVEAAAPNPDDLVVDLKNLESVTEILAGVKQLRQFYQLERDKVHKFWEITQKELENSKHELLNVDAEMEEMESKHQVEIKVYKQKIRHLLYEHRLHVQEVRAECDRNVTESIDEHHQRVEALKQEKVRLLSGMGKEAVEHEEMVLKKRDDHRHMLTTIKHSNYKNALEELEERYKNKINTLKEELDLRRRAEIHEIEERKNEHINQLIKLHQSKFAEMKSYYNQITGNNLDLIRRLKEDIAEMKRNDEHNENLMYDIEKENHHLSEPLENAKRDVAELQLQLHNYEKDKLSLRHTRSRLKVLDLEYKQLVEGHEELKRKYQAAYDDRESLKGRFEAALHEAMDVTQERNLTLQQRLVEMHAAMEEKDIELRNVLKAANLEPAAQDMLSRDLEEAVETKNRAIKDLHFELKKVERTHREVVGEYERRCINASIPVLDLEKVV